MERFTDNPPEKVMEGRVHMTAPDGRTFTFEEWCAYLKDEDDHDVNDPYIGMDGKVMR